MSTQKILRFDSVGGGSGDMILNALLEFCTFQGIPQDAVEAPLHRLIPAEHFHLTRTPKASHGMTGKMLAVDIHSHEHEHETPHDEHEHPHEARCEHVHSSSISEEPPHEHSHEHVSSEPLHEHTHSSEHTHEHSHTHVHRSYADIRAMIQASSLPEAAKTLSLEVFRVLAEAEGKVHSKPAEEVHFHEVGAVDSIIDIVGCCLAFTLLDVAGISLSPLPVGSGTVRCAHGVYPLPAPAAQVLLTQYGLEVSGDNEPCEMLTPTAAALFAVWKKAEIPANARIGASFNSFGHREMASRPNVLRVTMYECGKDTETRSSGGAETRLEYETESLIQLECNLDDVTGEQLSSTMQALFSAGALDVWFTPITMKKQRPAVLLGVLTRPELREKCIRTLFIHSGTFGIREFSAVRHFLERHWENVATPYGVLRMKVGTLGGVDVHFAPEFDDCQRAAEMHGVPVTAVIQSVISHGHTVQKK